jgi:hypothetical protein
MKQYNLKIGSTGQPGLSIKKFVGLNMSGLFVTKENMENLKAILNMVFNDPTNPKNSYRHIVFAEETVRDDHDRVSVVLCKAYFFREDDKALVLEVGRKNSIGEWILKDKQEIEMNFQRFKLVPSRWASIDFAISQIKLRGKANTILFYDENSLKKDLSRKNPMLFAFITKYFLNPNAH